MFQANRGFSFSSLAALINYAATFAIAFYLSLYLQYIHTVRIGFATFCLLCLTGIYFSLARGTIHSGPER